MALLNSRSLWRFKPQQSPNDTTPGHCAGFSFGAGNQPTFGLVLCDRKLAGINAGGGRYPARYPSRYPRNRAFLAPGKQPPVNSAVNTKYRICRGAVTAAVTAKQHFWSWVFPSEVSKVFPRNQAFAGLVTNAGFQAGFHGNRRFQAAG